MKSKGILFFLFFYAMIMMTPIIKAQQNGFDPKDPALIQKYAHYDFAGKFAVKVEADEKNNYYLVDFSGFKDKFEKITFMELVFKDDIIVSMSADLSKNGIWFMAPLTNPEKDMLSLLEEFRKSALKKAAGMTAKEKEAWLKENDKYK